MPYLILAIAVVVGLSLILLGLRGANPRTLSSFAKWLVIIFGMLLLAVLSLRGGLVTLGWIVIGLIPILLRWRALSRMARNWGGPKQGQSSDIETRYLRMTLDHDTGELKGTVLDGAFKGRLLEELEREQMLSLLQECRVHDEQSAQLLESYLDRIYGADWRAAGGGSGAESGGPAASGTMTREEAYSILGLQPGATAEQVKEAHRNLMVKFHPDQGGSTYLAAKINQAKDLLLNE